MKTKILCVYLFFSVFVANGQEDTVRSGDTTLVYIRGLPVTGERDDSTVVEPVREDLGPKTRLVKVPSDSIPEALLDALQRSEEYKGWDKSPVYYDKNTGLYTVYIDKGDDLHTYGLNSKGKPVTVNVSRKARD